MATSSALGRLRVLMGGIQPPLTAYIVSTNDRHQSEYLADCDQRRAFISGFTGSAGVALVTVDGAFLWTDGRYHIQASRQLDHNWQLMRQGLPNVPTLTEWMKKQLKSGASVGYDPSLVSEELYNQWKEPLTSNGIRLVPVEENLIDKIWEDRPPPSDAPIFVHPLKYAGESWQSKVNRIRKKMTGENCSVLVCTALDEVAWLYNLRGSDVECNPVFFSYAIVTMNDARLFVNSEQLTSEAHSQLVDCQIFPYSDVGRHMVDLIKTTEGKIWINSSSSHELCTLVPRARRIKKHNPIQLMKGIKNDAEIEGMRQAHIKCAVALCEYYSWLEEQLSQGKEVTELQGSEQLEIYRKYK
jgi:Xaa-Pro aminopeptidase